MQISSNNSFRAELDLFDNGSAEANEWAYWVLARQGRETGASCGWYVTLVSRLGARSRVCGKSEWRRQRRQPKFPLKARWRRKKKSPILHRNLNWKRCEVLCWWGMEDTAKFRSKSTPSPNPCRDKLSSEFTLGEWCCLHLCTVRWYFGPLRPSNLRAFSRSPDCIAVRAWLPCLACLTFTCDCFRFPWLHSHLSSLIPRHFDARYSVYALVWNCCCHKNELSERVFGLDPFAELQYVIMTWRPGECFDLHNKIIILLLFKQRSLSDEIIHLFKAYRLLIFLNKSSSKVHPSLHSKGHPGAVLSAVID